MDKNRVFLSLTQLFATGCILCTLMLLMMFVDVPPVVSLYPLLFPVSGPIFYLINRLFLRKERTVQVVTALNIGFFVLMFAAALALSRGTTWVGKVFIGLFCIFTLVQASTLAHTPPKLSGLMLSLDGSVLSLLLFIGLSALRDIPSVWAIPCAAGCMVSVFGVVSCRTHRAPGLRDSALLAVILGAVSALMWFVLHFLAEPAGKGIVTLWSLLLWGLRLAASAVLTVLAWILSLFPVSQLDVTITQTAENLSAPPMESLEESPVSGLLLAVFSALAAVAFLIWFLRKLGKLTVGGRRAAPAVQTVSRHRISLWEAVRQFFASVAEHFRLRSYLRKNKNNPKGLYFLLVHRCRVTPWRKADGETPREFLLRLRRLAEADEELSNALETLIPAVDHALFGDADRSEPFPQAALIRHRLGRAARRQSLRYRWNALFRRQKAS